MKCSYPKCQYIYKMNVIVCPRCKNHMTCLPGNVAHCPCSEMIVGKGLSAFLKKTKYDCLCNSCLKELESKVALALDHETSRKHTEGVHYYIEDGNLVFTEFAHIQRGYCCQSSCRHCAYGYHQEV